MSAILDLLSVDDLEGQLRVSLRLLREARLYSVLAAARALAAGHPSDVNMHIKLLRECVVAYDKASNDDKEQWP